MLNLQNAELRSLIRNEQMTLPLLAAINNREIFQVITHPDNLTNFIAGNIYLQDILGNEQPEHPIDHTLNIYQARQNTHTQSVHASTSQSATNLRKRYRENNSDFNLNEAIEKLRACLKTAKNVELFYNFKSRAATPTAKVCFERLTKSSYNFVDPTSQISIHELFALTYYAINETSKKVLSSTFEDALTLLIEGLYEIERGSNISQPQTDYPELASIPICPPGTFNKLIEKLAGIHIDCEVIFITFATISDKIKAIILEDLLTYLASNEPSGTTFLTRQEFPENKLFETNEWLKIWNTLKNTVTETITSYYADDNRIIEPTTLNHIRTIIAHYETSAPIFEPILKVSFNENPELKKFKSRLYALMQTIRVTNPAPSPLMLHIYSATKASSPPNPEDEVKSLLLRRYLHTSNQLL